MNKIALVWFGNFDDYQDSLKGEISSNIPVLRVTPNYFQVLEAKDTIRLVNEANFKPISSAKLREMAGKLLEVADKLEK